MSVLGNPDFEKELYYLVVKFLENGPCTEAAQVLRHELEDNKLVIPRKDWQGGTRERSFTEYDRLNNHVSPNHLEKIASSINSLLQKCYPTSVKSINSLLPRGAFSVLRTDVQTRSEGLQTTAKHAVTSHTSSRLIPSFNGNYLSIVPILNGRSLSGVKANTSIVSHCNIYSKLCMHKRLLGHLASVYCVLFDRTGSIIATGADDNLLKLWSARDGRLVATLRGHAGQITDIDINKENTLIAAGSLDKTIRVWKLKDTYPVAVLQGHTGMITSLLFCPYVDDNVRYLMSTGGDGHVCFWIWDPKTTEFSLTPIKFNEKSRPGAQMLCSSFSPGGSFLVTGSSDNYIRVYLLYPDAPEKIAELPNHGDHVDSILYNHSGDRFLSGSRDGTAVIWYYRNGDWQAKCLDASKPLIGDVGLPSHTQPNEKLKVTMICWNKNDYYVITAGTDCFLRVWNSHTATLIHALKGHTDEVYGLEAHPTEPSLLLSAGHDGHMIIWNIYTGERIKVFFNMLEGQGHGAIFDCKFSPDGYMFSATDSHGHLLMFGFGSNERYEKVPYEQFFHSDYRPIIRDANNYVLDEQNQMAPHLMPPPFLVDIDGNPYQSEFQLLIPGRNASNLPQLRIEPVATDGLPPLIAEIAVAEAEQNLLNVPGTNARNRNRSNQDMAPFSPGGGGGVGLRESGDVEGVRQQNLYTSGDINDADAEAWRNRTIIQGEHIYNEKEDELSRLQQGLEERAKYLKEKTKRKRRPSEGAHDTSHEVSRGRGRGRGRGRARQAKVRQNITYVRQEAFQMLPFLHSAPGGQVVNLDGPVHQSSDSEPEDWQGESSESTDDSDWVQVKKPQPQKESTRKRKKKRSPSMQYDFGDEDDYKRSSSNHYAFGDEDDDNEAEDVDVDGTDTDPAEGTDDEDTEWNEIPSITVQDVKGCKVEVQEVDMKKYNFTPVNSEDENEKSSGSSKNNIYSGPSRDNKYKKKKTGKQKAEKKKSPMKKKPVKIPKKVKKVFKSVMPVPPLNDLDAYLQFYHPPEWLLSVEPRKFPYFPQIMDEVFYLRQGHELYGREVIRQNIYDFHEERQAYRRKDLSPVELCKLVGVTYDVGPPKICSLKLELLDKGKRSSGGKRTITIRFHDLPGVADFLVLKHIYENAMQDCWEEGDRFRCIIDDSWYVGTIVEVSPYEEKFLTSPFLSLVIKWDSGDDERLSPWDLEKIPRGQSLTDDTPVSKKDKLLYQYTSTERDWPHENKEKLAKRVAKGLREISELDIAAPFAFPVNVNVYPTYWSCIAIPTDLETIRKRLENSFYRRIDSLLWEVRQLLHNTLRFNETASGIVSDGQFIVKLLCKFIKDPMIKDIVALYSEMDDRVEIKGDSPYDSKKSEDEEARVEGEEEEEEAEDEDEEEDEEDDVEEEEEEEEVAQPQEARSWTDEAKFLLEFLVSRDDAAPFRGPVDLAEFPDYLEHVAEPIDISIIRQRLESSQYDNADSFIRDFQSVFKNSKAYNTDRRSLIYKMTLRLSALFESRVQSVRQAYALSIANDVHLTRARTRNRRRGLNLDTKLPEIESTNENIEVPVQIEYVSDVPDNVFSPVDSKSPLEKDIVTLDEFIKRPVTRSRRPNTNYQNGVGCSKNTNIKDYTESSGESESDSNCSDDNRKSSVSSYEDLFKEPSGKSQKSNRIFKRCRYNYDSDNIGASRRKKFKINNGGNSIKDYKSEVTNNESPKITTRTNNASASRSSRNNNESAPKTTRKNTLSIPRTAQNSNEAVVKTSRNNESIPRTSRNRTAINYYEDDFDPFDILMEEDNKSNQSKSSDHEQNGEEEEEVEDEVEEEVEDKVEDFSDKENSSFESDSSSTSHEDVATVVSGVSSRGRIRKAASRFNDFVDK